MRKKSRGKSRQGILLAATFGYLLFPISTVFAQAQPSLTITFTSAIASVPISPWIAVFLSAVIASLALVLLRRGTARQFGKLPSLLLVAVIVAAFVTGTLSGIVLREANAQPASIPFPLTVSPAVIAMNSVPSTFQATNQTQASLTITSMTVSNAVCVAIAFPPSTCTIGEILQPGQFCIIGVQQTPAPCP